MNERGLGIVTLVVIIAVIVVGVVFVMGNFVPNLSPYATNIGGKAINACTDSDGGINEAVRGTTCGRDGNSRSALSSTSNRRSCFTDSCINNNTLTEYYCTNSSLRDSTEIHCRFGCVNGACVGGNETHLECRGLSCAEVIGPGANDCVLDSDCSRLACVGQTCGLVEGNGPDLCNNNFDCGGGNETHLECVDNSCAIVNGSGPNLCNTNANCADGPDLAHLNLANSETNVPVNTSIIVWNTIQNIGNSASGLFVTKIEDLTANVTLGIFSTNLDAEKTEQFSMVYVVQGPSGIHTLRSILDVNNDVEESDETNNIITTSSLFVQ